MKLICRLCLQTPELVKGTEVYPLWPTLAHLNFWLCRKCDAYVGCHLAGANVQQPDGTWVRSDGTLPLGRLANPALRAAKRAAHAAFDPIWKDGVMSRKEAYAWLANELNIPVLECHMGEFDCQQCATVVKICHARLLRTVAPQRSLL